MRPDTCARPEYIAAFCQIAKRIQDSLAGVPKRALPIQMYVAGGAAMHFYTGERVSKDIDAAFSRRILLPEDLQVAYRDADGAARPLYFDHQYNDTLGLMHADAREDSLPLSLEGIEKHVLDIRLLAPVDLAASKISRFTEQDRNDIAALARRKLFSAPALRKRANEAMLGYVGNTDWVRRSIDVACRIVDDVLKRGGRAPKPS